MDFNVLLVSLVPMDEELFKAKNGIKDITIFESALDFSEERPEGYSIKIYVFDQDKGLMAGAISKRTRVNLHDKNFSIHEEEDYPPVIWFWDRSEQCILIEKRTKVFSTPEASSKAFSIIANNIILAESGIRAHIYPKSETSEFWGSMEHFKYVHHVQFKLTAPNLFGKTKKELGDFLHGVVDETNATEFSPMFSSKDGHLSIKPSSWVTAIIDWVSEGAGSWIIKGRNNPTGRMKSIESVKKARVLCVEGEITEVELENYSSEDVSQILDVLREKYTYKK